MGRGLAIGSTKLFAAADFLLRWVESGECGCILTEPVFVSADAEGWPHTRVFTRIQLAEAWAMLIRMGYVPSQANAR